MTAPQPHPLRCVTCEYSNDKAGGRCPAWANNKFIIEKIGCASHSAAPNAQAIRQDDREKVLDEVIAWCESGIDALQEKEGDYPNNADTKKINLLRFEISWLKELRQERDPR